MRLHRNWWMLVWALTAAGCHRSRPEPPATPETQLQRALSLFRTGEFRDAQLRFQRLSFELPPGHPELVTVRYHLAECYFQTGDHLQAAQEFRRIADEFPSSEYAALALLRAGDANLRLWRRPELDPTYGDVALATYQELAGRYPDSEAAARARAHVRRLQNQFAEKTYQTGVFYLKRKAFDSAIIYFKDVIAHYPEAERAPDALLRLVDSYRAIEYTEELRETCAHLRRFYPRAAGLERTCPASAATSLAVPPVRP
ncbi:MAG: outer membrane protein assembly factor BamD [Gemmatimonadales bacterium]